MIMSSDWHVSFDFFAPKPILVAPQQAQVTSDTGLLPIRQFDQQSGLTVQSAGALHDPRDPDSMTHSFTEMVRMRIGHSKSFWRLLAPGLANAFLCNKLQRNSSLRTPQR